MTAGSGMLTRRDDRLAARSQILEGVGLAIQWIARQQGLILEVARIQRALSEVMQSGCVSVEDDWRTWVVAASRSLGLHLQIQDCHPKDLRTLLQSGGVALTLTAEGSSLAGLKEGKRQRMMRAIDFSDLHSSDIRYDKRPSWSIVVTDPEPVTHHEEHHEVSALAKLWELGKPEFKDILAGLAISGVAGLLLLSIPVTAQQLVRTVTFATLYQPVIVLSLMLLGLLGFVAALQLLHFYIAEVIQRRLFVRVATRVARHLTWVTPSAQRKMYLPELMNRFLDVGIIQKTGASLIVDGVAIVLSTAIGMVVMAFYHPFLLGYDLMLLFGLAIVVFVLGRGGTETAIQESKQKYKMVAWLQELSASCGLVREYGMATFAAENTDLLAAKYLKMRGAHFRVLLRQVVVVLGLQALATTTLLGLGGYLVLKEQLTLGQLVAAELIVATIVASFAKLSKHIENWYDLLAAVDKVSHLTDVPLEELSGTSGLPRIGAARLEMYKLDADGIPQGAAAGHAAEADESETQRIIIEPGEIEVLYNWSCTERAELIEAFRDPAVNPWTTNIDGLDLKELRPDIRWLHIALLDEIVLFPSSIAENVHMHRHEVTDLAVHRIIERLGLLSELEAMGLRLEDSLPPHGYPLSVRQLHKLHLARVLAGHPRLVVLDHWLDVFGDDELPRLVSNLFQLSPQTSWLILTAQRRVEAALSHARSAVRKLEVAEHV